MTGDSWASSETARRIMKANKGRNTGPEMRLRRELYRRGLRFRVSGPAVRATRADILFTGASVAIFVDGCFWHGCPEHFVQPKTNQAYWAPKIARNQQRDAQVRNELRRSGWAVVEVWEHEPLHEAADRVASHVELRGNQPRAIKARARLEESQS